MPRASCRNPTHGLETAFCSWRGSTSRRKYYKKEVNESAVQTLSDHMLYMAERRLRQLNSEETHPVGTESAGRLGGVFNSLFDIADEVEGGG